MKFSNSIVALVVTLLLAGGACTGAYLFFQSIKGMNEKISASANRIEEAAHREQLLESLKKTLQNSEDNRETLDSFILGSDGIVDFVESVEELGKITRATTTMSGFSETDSGQPQLTYLSMRVNIEGTWQKVYRVTALIESLPYALTVESVSISKDRGAKDKWGAALTLRTLKYK